MKEGFIRLQKALAIVEGREVEIHGVKPNGTPSATRFETKTGKVVSLSSEEMDKLPKRFKKIIGI